MATTKDDNYYRQLLNLFRRHGRRPQRTSGGTRAPLGGEYTGMAGMSRDDVYRMGEKYGITPPRPRKLTRQELDRKILDEYNWTPQAVMASNAVAGGGSGHINAPFAPEEITTMRAHRSGRLPDGGRPVLGKRPDGGLPQAPPSDDLMSFLASLDAATGGALSGGGVGAPKLDIAGMLKPYDDMKAALNTNAGSARERLKALEADRLRNAQHAAAADQARLVDLQALAAQTAQAADNQAVQDAGMVNTDGLGAAAGLVNAQSAAAVQGREAAAGNDQRLIQDQSNEARRQADFRKMLDADAVTGSRGAIDANLFSGMNEVSLARGKAEAELLAQQQQMDMAAQQAALEQAAQGDSMRQDAIAALNDLPGAGRVWNKRDAVEQVLQAYAQKNGADGVADDLFRMATAAAEDPQTAMANVLTAIAGENKRRAEMGLPQRRFSLPWFQRLVGDYYSTDRNRLRPEAMAALQEFYG